MPARRSPTSKGLLSGLLRLPWSAPSKAFPHGLSGLASSCIGAYLIIPALSGNIDLVRSAPLLLYVAAAIVNALAGIAIAGRAPKKYRPAFRLCAAFQCCLVYFVWRFSPGFPFGGTLVSAAMDALVGALLLLGIVAIALFSLLSLPLVLGVAISIGSAALALLAGYPLQLAVLGEEWWQCVQADYPLQSEAMVAYIYIPATWAFGLMLFGATLWTRNLIGDLGLGAGFAGVVMSTLVATVLFQEVWHPEPASTQKLWLPCPPPAPGSWSAWMVTNLDTSALAKTALRAMGFDSTLR